MRCGDSFFALWCLLHQRSFRLLKHRMNCMTFQALRTTPQMSIASLPPITVHKIAAAATLSLLDEGRSPLFSPFVADYRASFPGAVHVLAPLRDPGKHSEMGRFLGAPCSIRNSSTVILRFTDDTAGELSPPLSSCLPNLAVHDGMLPRSAMERLTQLNPATPLAYSR